MAPRANPSQDAEAEARRMFHGVISGWAMDALRLRRRGMDVPGARRGSRAFAAPEGRTPTGEGGWHVEEALRHPAWREARDRAA